MGKSCCLADDTSVAKQWITKLREEKNEMVDRTTEEIRGHAICCRL
jgi:hypothetical protein